VSVIVPIEVHLIKIVAPIKASLVSVCIILPCIFRVFCEKLMLMVQIKISVKKILGIA
jgi:hypothetical protein